MLQSFLSNPKAQFATAFGACIVLTAVTAVVASNSTPDYSVTLRLAHTRTAGSLSDLTAYKFKELLEQNSNGTMTVTIYPANGLTAGDQLRSIELLKEGALDLQISNAATFSGVDKRFEAFAIPYLFENEEQVKFIIKDEDARNTFTQWLSADGLKLIAMYCEGPRQLTNNVKEIKTPEDLKGLLIRANPVELVSDAYVALGAQPVRVDAAGVRGALEKNQIQGQDSTIATFVSANLYENQKYVTKWNATYDTQMWVGNIANIDKLTDAQKKALQKSADEAVAWGNSLADNFNKLYTKSLNEKGVQLTELSEEELLAFKSALYPVFEKSYSLLGADTFKFFLTHRGIEGVNKLPAGEKVVIAETPVEAVESTTETTEVATAETPVEAVEPTTETTEVAAAETPVEAVEPTTETTEVAATETPVEAVESTETTEIAATETPVEAVESTETTEIAATETPVEAVESTETTEVAAAETPVEAVESTETTEVAATETPVEAVESTETTEVAATETPVEAVEPTTEIVVVESAKTSTTEPAQVATSNEIVTQDTSDASESAVLAQVTNTEVTPDVAKVVETIKSVETAAPAQVAQAPVEQQAIPAATIVPAQAVQAPAQVAQAPVEQQAIPAATIVPAQTVQAPAYRHVVVDTPAVVGFQPVYEQYPQVQGFAPVIIDQPSVNGFNNVVVSSPRHLQQHQAVQVRPAPNSHAVHQPVAPQHVAPQHVYVQAAPQQVQYVTPGQIIEVAPGQYVQLVPVQPVQVRQPSQVQYAPVAPAPKMVGPNQLQ